MQSQRQRRCRKIKHFKRKNRKADVEDYFFKKKMKTTTLEKNRKSIRKRKKKS